VLHKLCLIAALAFLYLTNLGSVGFLGPDEPRYASIGREMARSGDWVTPRLDGQPWFEKPPLLYWTTAIATRFGLRDEWAARLPVALIGLGFLLFFYRALAREFSERIAIYATAILGTSAGWASLSFAAVTDLPMAATLNAAVLIALFGPQTLGSRATGTSEGRYKAQGYLAGFLLGLAILAKAFVPLLLIAPVLLVARRKRLRILAACLLTAAPWHIWCYMRNGSAFWDVYFWQHQVGRFLSPSLEHVQPFWFPTPVLLAGLFPWTPLAIPILTRRTLNDPRVRFLLFFVLFGLLFFSASTNKLATYVLPLIPAMSVVMAVALDNLKFPSWWLAVCALLLAVIPMIAVVLPDALNSGVKRVEWQAEASWALLIPIAAAIAAWSFGRTGPDNEPSSLRQWAPLVVAVGTVLSVVYLKWSAFPSLDRQVSVRTFWRENRQQVNIACQARIRRMHLYGLNYYAEHPLPECTSDARPRIVQKGDFIALE
jgi:4-amino-4-deoxy-L-arabinose transferase-like glycosyltransferase